MVNVYGDGVYGECICRCFEWCECRDTLRMVSAVRIGSVWGDRACMQVCRKTVRMVSVYRDVCKCVGRLCVW
jgi:hypothetical protein